jgi:hypothetical protein
MIISIFIIILIIITIIIITIIIIINIIWTISMPVLPHPAGRGGGGRKGGLF